MDSLDKNRTALTKRLPDFTGMEQLEQGTAQVLYKGLHKMNTILEREKTDHHTIPAMNSVISLARFLQSKKEGDIKIEQMESRGNLLGDDAELMINSEEKGEEQTTE